MLETTRYICVEDRDPSCLRVFLYRHGSVSQAATALSVSCRKCSKAHTDVWKNIASLFEVIELDLGKGRGV